MVRGTRDGGNCAACGGSTVELLPNLTM